MISNIPFSKGLPLEQWKSLESQLQGLGHREETLRLWKQEEPLLADYALEAGCFELACWVGCSHPLLQVKALFQAGQKTLAQSLWESLEENSIEKILCHIFLLRASGQSPQALQLYSSGIEKILSSLSVRIEIEARLQWALVLYALEKWNDVVAIYKIVFERSEQAELPGPKAIASFNLATVYQNQKQKLEAMTWLWRAEKELQSYRLDHLQASLELFELQCDLQDLADEKVLTKTPSFLKKNFLSPQQRLRALHTLAESQSEWGQILDAEMTLSQARKWLQTHHLDQYRAAQETLELNLASILHRPSRFQTRRQIQAQSLRHHEQAALARWALKMNDLPRALRLTLTLEKELGPASEFEDLFVLLSNRLEQPGARPRTLENQIFGFHCHSFSATFVLLLNLIQL